MKQPLTRKGAFRVLKLRAMTLHKRRSERPRLVTEYHALLQALHSMMDISGAGDKETQIHDDDVLRWYAEEELRP